MTKPANASQKFLYVVRGLGDDPEAWWSQPVDEKGAYTENGPFKTVAEAVAAARDEAELMGWVIAPADKLWPVDNEAVLSVDE